MIIFSRPQVFQDLAYIFVDQYGSVPYEIRAFTISEIKAGICRLRVFSCPLPERILDYNRFAENGEH